MLPKFLQTYGNEVSQQLDFLPNWPLDCDVQLGDVGLLDGSVFKRTSTLEQFGIYGFAVRKGQGTELLEFSSREGVEIIWAAGGENATAGLGGELEIKFSRDGAVFLRVGQHTLEQIESTDTLGEKIIQLYENGKWLRNRVVVTEVVRAAAATVLVSGNGSASAKLKVDAAVPGIEALARGNLSQLVSVTGSFTTKIVGASVSPLLRTCGLRGLFRTEFKTAKSPKASGQAEALKFARVDSSDQFGE